MDKYLHEALLYTPLKAKTIQCNLCGHNCTIMPAKGKPVLAEVESLKKENFGICGTRVNIEGKLYALSYGLVTSLNVDPVEKKPLYHFMPGSNLLSFGGFGCNFCCPNCHNWQISQVSNPTQDRARNLKFLIESISPISPAEIISQAVEYDCKGIAYTYNEPTISLEFIIKVMELAKKSKLANVWVTNGFFSPKALDLITPLVDAFNVDLKSYDPKFYHTYCKGRLSQVLKNLQLIKEKRKHLEITTLIIPELTNSEKIISGAAEFICKLSPNTPWHLINFVSDISWQMQNWKSAGGKELKKAHRIAKEAGLKFVYANAGELNNTLCPKCKTLNIARWGYTIKRYDKEGYCYSCGEDLVVKP